MYPPVSSVMVVAIHRATMCITALVRPLTLLTPWCRVLIEKLTGLQLVKKFPAFHGTRRFITALTSVRHPSLSWASPIQSLYTHPTSWRSILILSAHLRLGVPSGLLPSGFPTKTLYTPSPQPYTPQKNEFHTYLKVSLSPLLRPNFNSVSESLYWANLRININVRCD